MTNPDDDRTIPQLNFGPGTVVAQYELQEKLGAGGMGEVYLARDTKLQRQVALKFLPDTLAAHADLRARFLREARAAAALDHPYIVTVHEVGEADGRPFIAMQYVEGRTLEPYTGGAGRHGELTLKQILELGAALAEALAKAHAAGVVHRDIKPGNILVDDELRPKIVDFGLAAVSGGEGLTQAGVSMGTPAYMSPEQVRGEPVDSRSDLFSLGVVMYELVAGRSPFRRDNAAATQQAILTQEPEPLARYKSQVPDDLQRVVSRCLAKDPVARHASAKDLAAELRLVLSTLSGSAASAPGKREPSVAVLPFANLSNDPENEFFSDGLTEELLNVLAKNRELKVTGRTSSFAFKGKQVDLRDIGHKLGVTTLLEGSVRKAGNRVRITAQLVNAADGFHLWSETYDRVLEDIFAVQDEIAQAVGEALNVTLLGESGAGETEAVDAQSYELMLRAQYALYQMSETGANQALQLYDKVLLQDPENARAWAGLSRTRLVFAAFGFQGASSREFLSRAKEAGERALALDPNLALAHETMGWLHAFTCRHAMAMHHFERAYELAPNNSTVVSSYATILSMKRSFAQAFKLSARAIELDPLNAETLANHGRILLADDQLEGALQAFQRARELSPNISLAIGGESWCLLRLGRYDEALRVASKQPQKPYRAFMRAMIYHEMGRREESEAAMTELLQENEDWAFQFACAHAVREERDEAFSWLEKAAANYDAGVPNLLIAQQLRNLHEDPRWGELTRRLGFTEAQEERG